MHGPLSDAFDAGGNPLRAHADTCFFAVDGARIAWRKKEPPLRWLSLAVPLSSSFTNKYAREFIEAEVASFSFPLPCSFRRASESKRYTHLLPRSMFCKLDIRLRV